MDWSSVILDAFVFHLFYFFPFIGSYAAGCILISYEEIGYNA
jgi:hypothetical protein